MAKLAQKLGGVVKTTKEINYKIYFEWDKTFSTIKKELKKRSS